MKEIFFIRHAEALAISMLDVKEDISRPLSPRGRQQALNLAAFIKEFHFLPDKIVCSTALRARQTFAYLKPNFPPHAEVNFEPFLYENSLERLSQYLEDHPPTIKKICVIGHNSLIEQAFDFLLSGQDKQKLIPFKNATIAVLKNSAEEWVEIPDRLCSLETFFVSENL